MTCLTTPRSAPVLYISGILSKHILYFWTSNIIHKLTVRKCIYHSIEKLTKRRRNMGILSYEQLETQAFQSLHQNLPPSDCPVTLLPDKTPSTEPDATKPEFIRISCNINTNLISFLYVCMVNTMYLLSFVETPRKFIIAELSIRKLGSSSVLIIRLFEFTRPFL